MHPNNIYNKYGGDNLTEFLETVQEYTGVGDAFWSLFGHDDECCQYVEHDDGYSFYYLRENNSLPFLEQGKVITDHAAAMRGLPGRFCRNFVSLCALAHYSISASEAARRRLSAIQVPKGSSTLWCQSLILT